MVQRILFVHLVKKTVLLVYQLTVFQVISVDLKNKKGITNVGNLKEVNLEKVAELEPDLIILSGRTQGQMDEFKKIAPTIYFETSSKDYWGSVKSNIQELAKVFGDKTEKTVKTKISEIDQIVKKSQEANKDTQSTTLTVMLNEGNMAGVSPEGRSHLSTTA